MAFLTLIFDWGISDSCSYWRRNHKAYNITI